MLGAVVGEAIGSPGSRNGSRSKCRSRFSRGSREEQGTSMERLREGPHWSGLNDVVREGRNTVKVTSARNWMWSIATILIAVGVAQSQTNTFPATGNVGIGTTAPLTTLHVQGSQGIYSPNATSPASPIGGSLYLGDSNFENSGYYNSAPGLSAVYNPTSGGVAGALGFYVYTGGAGGANSRTEAMRILPSGDVGIGTASPFSELHIIAGNANGVYGPPTSGNMSHGLVISNTLGGPAIDEGVYADNNINLSYGWIQSAFVNNANVTVPLALNPVGGNVGIGTPSPGAKLEVDGNVKLTSGSGASITFADGSVQSTAYTGVSCGGDFAESVDVTGNRHHYEPGDLLVIDPDHPGDFDEAAQPYSTLVAGIYSTKPGYVGRRLTGPKSPDEVPLAMVGIVPTKVTAENGPIHTGDLLVASSTPGRAMKGTDRGRLTGAVVGKALGTLESGNGTIEVLVTLQ